MHRMRILQDLVSVFKDSSVLDACLKMDFINEKAVDDAGVSREVYTAFWEQFLQQCEGETERVPRLPRVQVLLGNTIKLKEQMNSNSK